MNKKNEALENTALYNSKQEWIHGRTIASVKLQGLCQKRTFFWREDITPSEWIDSQQQLM